MRILDRVLRDRRIEPYVSAALRSRLVHESAPFFASEIRGRRDERVYRIRENGLRALIAHGTPDVLTLDQAFYQHVYEPPAAVTARLHEGNRRLRALAASWELIEAAATCADERVSFTTGQATIGRIGDGAEPGTADVDGRDAFALLEGLDLLKIDIEGAEWQLLADARFAEVQVPVIMLEHHPYGARSDDPNADATRALERVGYATSSLHGAPDGTGVVWGYRA
jgi:FkbM family methyltransferase